MRVFVTGGTGHAGSYIIPELIAAGHEVTGLARSDTAAAALSALGAKVRRGDLEDLDGLKEAAADSDGVIHVAHRQDLLPSGGIDAVAAAELQIMLAYGEALAGTGKPLVAAGSIGSAWKPGPAGHRGGPGPSRGEEYKGTLRVRNVVERTVVGLAERGVRSSIVRLPLIAHGTTDNAGFLPLLIALAKEKGVVGYPGDGANLWTAVHIRDVASLFRLALEKGPAGRYWHAIAGRGHPVPRNRRGHRQPSGPARREHSRGRADAAGILRAVHESGHADLPASNLITRQTLGWEPAQPGLLADLDNGHYFPPADGLGDHLHQEEYHDHVRPAPRHLGVLRRLHQRRRRQRHPHPFARRGRWLYGPFGDEPVTGREAAVDTIQTVNGMSSDDTYMEVLSGETHHAAHFRLQIGDAAVNGIFFVLLDADGKIAEVSIFYRTLPAGVALQRNLADATGMEPWELRTNGE